MKIHFVLVWGSKSGKLQRAFKQSGHLEAFLAYVKRIATFATCDVVVSSSFSKRSTSSCRVVICDRGQGSKQFDSEGVAALIQKYESGGVRDLFVLIGGANGFRDDDFKNAGADLKWSFGALTYPHELAAVMASEQIYRALTIKNNHPYHLGH